MKPGSVGSMMYTAPFATICKIFFSRGCLPSIVVYDTGFFDKSCTLILKPQLHLHPDSLIDLEPRN